MKTILILVGKTQSKIFKVGIDDYVSRIEHYMPFSITTIPELKNTKSLSGDQQKQKEGELILKEINKISENKNSVEKIFVVGGLGKRIDMILSNLFIMEKYKNLVFLQENEEIFYVEKSFVLKNKKEYEFSIIPISEKVEKLTLKGFKFETDKIDVKRESSRLVSNVICGDEASVEFESGKLIIILKNNNKNI